MQVCIKEQ